MADAKKCDRCGDFYERSKTELIPKVVKGVRRQYYEYYEFYDLCPNCLAKLRIFLANK